MLAHSNKAGMSSGVLGIREINRPRARGRDVGSSTSRRGKEGRKDVFNLQAWTGFSREISIKGSLVRKYGDLLGPIFPISFLFSQTEATLGGGQCRFQSTPELGILKFLPSIE